MKRLMLIATVCLAATPALAMKVTNLDNVPHRVVFSASGNDQVRDIAPGSTEYFVGQPSGMLSLVSAQQPKPSQGTLHADGLLSGIVGAARSENIPADTDDVFAIWPGGHLGLQQHIRTNRGSH